MLFFFEDANRMKRQTINDIIVKKIAFFAKKVAICRKFCIFVAR